KIGKLRLGLTSRAGCSGLALRPCADIERFCSYRSPHRLARAGVESEDRPHPGARLGDPSKDSQMRKRSQPTRFLLRAAGSQHQPLPGRAATENAPEVRLRVAERQSTASSLT